MKLNHLFKLIITACSVGHITAMDAPQLQGPALPATPKICQEEHVAQNIKVIPFTEPMLASNTYSSQGCEITEVKLQAKYRLIECLASDRTFYLYGIRAAAKDRSEGKVVLSLNPSKSLNVFEDVVNTVDNLYALASGPGDSILARHGYQLLQIFAPEDCSMRRRPLLPKALVGNVVGISYQDATDTLVLLHEGFGPTTGPVSLHHMEDASRESPGQYIAGDYTTRAVAFREKFLLSTRTHLRILGTQSKSIEKEIPFPEGIQDPHIAIMGSNVLITTRGTPTQYFLMDVENDAAFTRLSSSALPENYRPMGVYLRDNLLCQVGQTVGNFIQQEEIPSGPATQPNGVFVVSDIKSDNVLVREFFSQVPHSLHSVAEKLFVPAQEVPTGDIMIKIFDLKLAGG